MGRGYETSVQLFTQIYNSVPHFTDVFDAETFHIFAFLFVIGTLLIAFILSRFITIKDCENDW